MGPSAWVPRVRPRGHSEYARYAAQLSAEFWDEGSAKTQEARADLGLQSLASLALGKTELELVSEDIAITFMGRGLFDEMKRIDTAGH